MPSLYDPLPPSLPYRSENDRSCRTIVGSNVVLANASQIGSTSGPSRSPAPSHPQHHTARFFVSHLLKTLERGSLPYGGGGLKTMASLSSPLNSRS